MSELWDMIDLGARTMFKQARLSTKIIIVIIYLVSIGIGILVLWKAPN